MGIPYLFSHLRRRYPQAVSSAYDNNHIDELYIDFNAVIHDVASRSSVCDEDVIIAGTLDYVKNLPPSCMTLLAFDGIAPLSKMRQQRSRRFLHEIQNNTNNETMEDETLQWDRTQISPGTPFMKRLESALATYLDATPLSGGSGHTIIMSGTDQHGEGEQKIFKMINANAKAKATAETKLHAGRVVIMGLDADLILMSLISPRWREIELWRSTGERLVVKELHNRIEHEIPIPDFVCLCMLLGNDFIPALPGLRLKTSGLQEISKIYLDYRPVGHKGPWLATGNGPAVAGGIRIDVLTIIINKLSKIEHSLVREADAAYHDNVYRTGKSNDEITNFIHAPGYGASWIERYRYALFEDKRAPDEVALMYLCGLAWTYQYLGMQTIISRGWVYPYGYAPPSFDIANLLTESTWDIVERMRSHFDSADKKVINFESMIPSWIPVTEPYLFLILPPRSLKNVISTIDVDRVLESEAGYMYPAKNMYTARGYLKYHEWEYDPSIPEVDLAILAHCISESF
jgi:5'-3' exonuclease